MQLAETSLVFREPGAAGLFLSRLEDMAKRERTPACVQVRARNAHALFSLDIDGPVLALPVQGRKRFRDNHSKRWIRVAPGEIFLIPHALTLDVENTPDATSGWYSAVCITLEEHVLNAARQLVREPPKVASPGGLACVALEPHTGDLNSWLDALEQGDSPRACHALVGVVLRLYSQGHRGLLYPPPPTLAARIRALVAADPTRDWTSAHLEAQLAMSGATLRRHLAAEGVTLRDVISDARISRGLILLLSTRLPVKSVAQRVGYASVSAFIKRFREKYGIEPSRVENGEPQPAGREQVHRPGPDTP